jgi:hypothetical protein
MPTVQKWGRKESIIWPPRGYLYTLGAFFLALVATGLFIWIRFQFALTPLERYYLPYYLRSETAGIVHPSNQYQMLVLSDGKTKSRIALDADVQKGETPQPDGKSLPIELKPEVVQKSAWILVREPQRNYSNKVLHDWLAQWVYSNQTLFSLFRSQCLFGLALFLLQLPYSIKKDIGRIKMLRYGRRLKGPILLDAKAFTEAVGGDGIGIATDDSGESVRIPRGAENKHFLVIGDTGSGKSSIIRQFLYQIDKRDEAAIVYDPAGDFLPQFYNPRRGDIVLNPLDARMPYWSPAKELRRKAEAKALAVSLYQPEKVTNEFFVEAPQKIIAYLLGFLPTPEDLVHWMCDPSEIDRRLRNSEYWAMIEPSAPQQRMGVISSLNMVAESLRLLPKDKDTSSTWTATEWSKNRQGWIFITTQSIVREALKPLISLWIDLLVLRLLNERNHGQRRVWFVIDELASLQRLPQLHTAITENRKSQNPLVLGFQGRSQMESRYGDDAEAMLSQPATKIFLRTSEPRAAKWVSEAIGEIEIERLRETHYEGMKMGRNFVLDRQVEPLVLPSEITGLDDMHGYLKYGNHVARFTFPFVELDEKGTDYEEREMDDLLVPRAVPLAGSVPEQGKFSFPEPGNKSLGNQLE